MTTTDQTITTDRASLLRVGDIARATGKTVRAIHLYEELGLLKPAMRSNGGFRLFDPSAVDRVRWIDSLHGLGFSLQEMRAVLENWWTSEQGPAAMADLRELFGRKLDETREAIRRHLRLESELEEGLRYLATCENCDAPGPVETCVNCRQDHGTTGAPALVAGIKGGSEGPPRATRPGFVRLEDMQRNETPPATPAEADADASRKEQPR